MKKYHEMLILGSLETYFTDEWKLRIKPPIGAASNHGDDWIISIHLQEGVL